MTNHRQRIAQLLGTLEKQFSTPAFFKLEWSSNPTEKYFDEFLVGLDPVEWAEAFEGLALQIAHDFLEGRRDFDVSDELMNDAYGVALHKMAMGYEYPPLFDEIYQAFDDGEWTHHEEFLDPVNQLTVPALRRIIGKASQS